MRGKYLLFYRRSSKWYQDYLKGKNILGCFGALASIVIAISTVIFGWRLWQINKFDLGPNVFVLDALLEVYDKTNSPVRRISLVQGELLQNKAVPNMDRMIMLVKFRNTGRLSAIVKINQIVTPSYIITPDNVTNNDPTAFREPILVPGGGETPWTLGIKFNMLDYCSMSKDLKYKYDLSVSDLELEETKSLKFSILCNFGSLCVCDEKGVIKSINNINPQCLISVN